MVKHKFFYFRPILASVTLKAVSLQLNGMLKMIKIKKCSYGKIFSPLTEISGTKPARPLIWTHRKFYKGFRGEARSRKRGQPGQPGSYEEALKRRASTSLEPGSAFGGEGWGWGEGEEEEKNGRKSNRGASREVIWGGEIEGYPGTRLDVDFICT